MATAAAALSFYYYFLILTKTRSIYFYDLKQLICNGVMSILRMIDFGNYSIVKKIDGSYDSAAAVETLREPPDTDGLTIASQALGLEIWS